MLVNIVNIFSKTKKQKKGVTPTPMLQNFRLSTVFFFQCRRLSFGPAPDLEMSGCKSIGLGLTFDPKDVRSHA